MYSVLANFVTSFISTYGPAIAGVFKTIVGAVSGIFAFLLVSFVMKKLEESKKPALNKIVSFDLIAAVKAKKN